MIRILPALKHTVDVLRITINKHTWNSIKVSFSTSLVQNQNGNL